MKIDCKLQINGGYLQSLDLSDVHHGYVDGLNDPIVNHYLDGVKASVQTKDTVEDFITFNLKARDAIIFGLWVDGVSRHVGTVRLHGIEHHHSTAHIGVCIFDQKQWGQGWGVKIINAVTTWAHESLSVRWIEAGVYEENIASRKAFISAGYKPVWNIYGKYLLAGLPSSVNVFASVKETKGAD